MCSVVHHYTPGRIEALYTNLACPACDIAHPLERVEILPEHVSEFMQTMSILPGLYGYCTETKLAFSSNTGHRLDKTTTCFVIVGECMDKVIKSQREWEAGASSRRKEELKRLMLS